MIREREEGRGGEREEKGEKEEKVEEKEEVVEKEGEVGEGESGRVKVTLSLRFRRETAG